MDGVDCDPDDEEHVDPDAIHPYAGHGTFVSGVIQCLAPGSTIDVEGALTHGGAVYESEICEQLHQALESKEHPQLISISAGTYTRNDMALLGFEMLAAAHGLDDGEDTLVVAAAGNDNTDDRFWPAAFPWVVGVGSVDPDGNRSDYSNHGTWVDVYARGRDLVNAFPVGTYTCHEPQNIHNGVADVRQFSGLAQWSGTSFSTPVVTGLIAARMSAANESAQQAKTAVLKGATTTGGLPVVGPLT
jgi:subtilisin family serine protease